MGIRLTPLASLCLGVVRGWINVARKGRGGQIDESGTAWTRLPADQLRDQLEREFLVEVSTRSIQRALKELEEAGGGEVDPFGRIYRDIRSYEGKLPGLTREQMRLKDLMENVATSPAAARKLVSDYEKLIGGNNP